MNHYDEESLKQEVIYLHSLWLQGPPTRNPIPTPNYIPIHDPIQRPTRPNYIPPADLHLLSRYGAFNQPPRNPNYYPPSVINHKRSRPDSDREWPVKESSVTSGSGWADFKPCKRSKPASEEEKAKYAANLLQREIHRSCRVFFGRNEEESDEEEGKEEDDCSKEVLFLTKVFDENVKLKEYYEKNVGNGEFWCLVCGGTGEKSVRKFKSCLALIQHSIAIHKTDLKCQHRALAQVVCNVLGWDVNNPVASSQKDSQTLGVEAVVEGATEVPTDSKKPQEKLQVMSASEQAKSAALQMQQDASEAFKDIVARDGEESEGNGDENLSEELEFISRAFSENVELKSYYEKNFEGGHFLCLLCFSATGKKMVKRFRHCHGLVQHCTKVPKIKIKIRAHKAFARFICKLLGWDFERLPRRVVKGGALLIESNANKKSEKPSSEVEDHMCEDKAETPQEKTEACIRL